MLKNIFAYVYLFIFFWGCFIIAGWWTIPITIIITLIFLPWIKYDMRKKEEKEEKERKERCDRIDAMDRYFQKERENTPRPAKERYERLKKEFEENQKKRNANETAGNIKHRGEQEV